MLERVTSNKTGWTPVAFGDVVRKVSDKVDPWQSGLERYVAGQHLDTDDLRIRRWGLIGNDYLGPAFHMRFKPRQVLYGSRRTYLRKVALAEFEGITANTTYVLETKSPEVLIPELLPFIMQTEAFHAHSISRSKGSVNPYINFSDIACFEFMLPPVQQQTDLVELLASARAHTDALTAHVDAARTVVYSAVDDVFERSTRDDGDKSARLKSLSTKIVDGVHHTPLYVQSGIPFLTVENLTRGSGIDFSDTRFITEEDHREFITRAHPEKGDVLISKDGTLGVPRVVDTDREFSIFVSVALVKPKADLLNPWFLRFYFQSSLFKRHIASRASGSALKHIHLIDLRESPIPRITIDDQKKAANKLSEIHSGLSVAESRVAQARDFFKRVLTTTMEGAE